MENAGTASDLRHPDYVPRLLTILESWRGTAYMEGQSARGVYVDCIHLVSAVLNEMSGDDYDPGRLGSGGNIDRASEMLQRAAAHYQATSIPTDELEPGDVAVADIRGRLHCLIVGDGELWHASILARRVTTASFGDYAGRLVSAWRPNKATWNG